MITLYKISYVHNRLEEIQATRATESTYYTIDNQGKERANRIKNQYETAFYSKEEAIEYARGQHLKRVENRKEALESAVRELDRFNFLYQE